MDEVIKNLSLSQAKYLLFDFANLRDSSEERVRTAVQHQTLGKQNIFTCELMNQRFILAELVSVGIVEK